ncbi:DNA-binding transcriptional regulator PaaX [Salirhabdus euzebyi]|uniref:DNA-binding transcriptional regulator PaaX n=1 Tax=Salirhabdus euzebyi TaxID=394506 RepID=A0A841Q3D5_9BACI|nr:hypothetical protein [Salirhabdus euzebyi]MBB6452897.1 DNA-binding transcriptional regulator PaaX [Salirhabdus euzebyi]
MSWKAVELQVALPRVQDAGQIQDQLQQRGQHVQSHLSQAQLQAQKRKRHQVNEMNRKEHDKILNDGTGESTELLLSSPRKGKQLKQSSHPYLGKIIDYSG